MSEMTMVERVIRGMRAAPVKPGEDMWEALARAAIAAMREPTGAMLNAGRHNDHTMGVVWRAMVDGALR